MDVNTVIQLINGVGFPIAACIGMGAFIVWDKKNRSQEQERRREEDHTMYQKLADAVENNTKIIQELVNELRKGA